MIVVTRLRLRDAAMFEEFFASAAAVFEQAEGSQGNLGADVLAEANNTFWTRTAWQDRSSLDGFVGASPHDATMSQIDSWCDEATFVNWEQETAELPSWETGYERLRADGQVSTLSNPSASHHTRDFPAPVVTS